ncbi:MAG: TRAP transporter TatT component family protein [Spirochaetota bacterium]
MIYWVDEAVPVDISIRSPASSDQVRLTEAPKMINYWWMREIRLSLVAAVLVLLSSCSLNTLGVRVSSSFMQEEDATLVGDSMPILLKASEILADGKPRDAELAATAASMAVMYAAGFVSADAAGVPDDDFDGRLAADARAKALFIRGFRRASAALDLRADGLMTSLLAGNHERLGRLKPKDVPLMYWTSASVLAAFSLDPFDPEVSRYLASAIAILDRAFELDADWDKGSLHELMIALAPALPAEMGGGMDRAEEAYHEALAASGGLRASPHVSYASSVAVYQQDYEAFKAVLEAALAVDMDLDPDSRLANVIAQAKARRLLGSADRLFLILDETEMGDY